MKDFTLMRHIQRNGRFNDYKMYVKALKIIALLPIAVPVSVITLGFFCWVMNISSKISREEDVSEKQE